MTIRQRIKITGKIMTTTPLMSIYLTGRKIKLVHDQGISVSLMMYPNGGINADVCSTDSLNAIAGFSVNCRANKFFGYWILAINLVTVLSITGYGFYVGYRRTEKRFFDSSIEGAKLIAEFFLNPVLDTLDSVLGKISTKQSLFKFRHYLLQQNNWDTEYFLDQSKCYKCYGSFCDAVFYQRYLLDSGKVHCGLFFQKVTVRKKIRKISS